MVAFQEVESLQGRMMRHLLDGTVLEGEPGSRPLGRGRYWCAADKPRTDDAFCVAAVYRTHVVPVDACCEYCGIGIRVLQELMTF